jgi:hypothetical protein
VIGRHKQLLPVSGVQHLELHLEPQKVSHTIM